jgi:proline iminopeptidase
MKKLSHAGHEIYLYDQAGSGLSDRLPRYSDISFYTHLQDLHEIITNHIKARKVILIGHSFGSLLAAHFSSSYPELIEKIIFTSPGQLQPLESDSSDGAGLSRKYPTPDSLHYLEPYSFVGDVDRTALTPKAILATTGALLFDVKLVSDEDMDRMLNTLIAKAAKGAVCDTTNPIPPEGGMGLYSYIATNNYSEVKDVRDKIRQLDIPILVIQGQCDFMPFAAAYEYVDLYKDGTFVFIENAGHIIWWEQPTKFLEVITGFLANR